MRLAEQVLRALAFIGAAAVIGLLVPAVLKARLVPPARYDWLGAALISGGIAGFALTTFLVALEQRRLDAVSWSLVTGAVGSIGCALGLAVIWKGGRDA